MKIPFDIKFKPQIESGEYKVETRSGKQVRVICWNKKSTTKMTIVVLCDDGDSEHTEHYTEKGTVYDRTPAGGDLFIITPEPELTSWQRFISGCLQKHGLLDCGAADRIAKESAAELLAIAREQFIKDGYVIEKKAFHDAVEKVDPEVMKDVSENADVSNFIAKLGERYPEVSFAKLTRIAKAAYDYGKAEVLKDLPRWRYKKGGTGPILHDCIVLNKYGCIGKSPSGALLGDVWTLEYDELAKLPKEKPGFKED